MKTGPKTKPVMERLWNKVKKGLDSECWVWLGCIHYKTGYGKIGVKKNGKNSTASVHRIVYEDYYGPIPLDFEIDHVCHTEACGKTGTECMHRRCVNPVHLLATTHKQNMIRDGSTIAGKNVAKTHCPSGHEYNEENTYFNGNHRVCRPCYRVTGRGRIKDPLTGRFIRLEESS